MKLLVPHVAPKGGTCRKGDVRFAYFAHMVRFEFGELGICNLCVRLGLALRHFWWVIERIRPGFVVWLDFYGEFFHLLCKASG